MPSCRGRLQERTRRLQEQATMRRKKQVGAFELCRVETFGMRFFGRLRVTVFLCSYYSTLPLP